MSGSEFCFRAARAFAGRSFFFIAVCLLLIGRAEAQQESNKSQPALDPARYARDIAAFLASDKTNPPPRQGVLFVGSSIFRQWTNVSEQMAPLPAFNRAFGGSLTTDVLHYMDKVVLPYEPRIIVYYCGSNDVNAGRNGPEIFDGFRRFVTRVHERSPATRIFYVSINRAPQKRDKWAVVDAANSLAREFCAKDRTLGFIDVNPALFNEHGEPRMELYQPDRLHFKPAAYERFSAILKPVLTKTWSELPHSTAH